MRILKPGKLGIMGSAERSAKKAPPAGTRTREIWDDYLVEKKKKKKEYQRDGNRMVPTPHQPSTKIHFGPRDAEANDDAAKVTEASVEEDYQQQLKVHYQELEAALGYSFTDQTLLLRALTHRSALMAKDRADYERLEFLGDAVLDLSVAHVLSDRYPEAREGELSKMRAALVNTQTLSEIAKGLNVSPFIRLGRGELSSGGNERPSILADVMEAIVGAIYRDSSYDVAHQVVTRVFGEMFDQVTPYDPKTELQEALHAAGSEPPNYLVELVEGPEHAPTFVTVVVVDGEIAGRGRGTTKKAAQQIAAAEALSRLMPTLPVIELLEGQRLIIPEAMLSYNSLQVGP